MFLMYTLEDKILLKPDDLNMKGKAGIMLYEEIVLDKAREKYIGKVHLNLHRLFWIMELSSR